MWIREPFIEPSLSICRGTVWQFLTNTKLGFFARLSFK